MRLTEHEKTSIKSIILNFDPYARIYIFGSRADDSKKGGDIDILVFSDKITGSDRRAIKLKLYEAIGEQKIDLLIAIDATDPFTKIALETGVPL